MSARAWLIIALIAAAAVAAFMILCGLIFAIGVAKFSRTRDEDTPDE